MQLLRRGHLHWCLCLERQHKVAQAKEIYICLYLMWQELLLLNFPRQDGRVRLSLCCQVGDCLAQDCTGEAGYFPLKETMEWDGNFH